jgi:hypothetical protein
MVVIQLDSGGSTWIWLPVALTEELKAEMTFLNLDNVQHVVSPNKIHHLFLKEWQDAFPKASFYMPPGLRDRNVAKDIRFDVDLSDNEETMPYRSEIQQVIV